MTSTLINVGAVLAGTLLLGQPHGFEGLRPGARTAPATVTIVNAVD